MADANDPSPGNISRAGRHDSLVIWGDLDLPHVQERSRHVATVLLNGAGHELTGAAHLPSLERPEDVTALLTEFINCCSGERGG